MRRFTWGVLIVLSCLGAASAAPVDADPVDMPPKSSQRSTIDGWALAVAMSGESINAVPNLAAAQNSREAFVTLSASATITGGGTNPVTTGSFVAGYQLGCQTDVSQGLQIGGTGQLIGSVGPGLAGTGSLGGYAQTNLQPGVITTLPIATMPLKGSLAHLDMQDVHVKVDACGGPVTIRSYATMAIATDVEQTQLSVYGDPRVL